MDSRKSVLVGRLFVFVFVFGGWSLRCFVAGVVIERALSDLSSRWAEAGEFTVRGLSLYRFLIARQIKTQESSSKKALGEADEEIMIMMQVMAW